MTPFLWILAGGFLLGIVLMIVFSIAKKSTGVIIGVAVAVVCMIFFVVDITVEPHKNGYEPSTAEEDTVGTATFEEIYKAYKENELVADDLYKNNRYQVTAKIDDMTNDGLFNLTGGATLTLEKTIGNTIVVFYAEFEKEQEENLKTVKVGDTITFVGECLSAGGWIDCELVVE